MELLGFAFWVMVRRWALQYFPLAQHWLWIYCSFIPTRQANEPVKDREGLRHSIPYVVQPFKQGKKKDSSAQEGFAIILKRLGPTFG